jgi:sporulation protein YabP
MRNDYLRDRAMRRDSRRGRRDMRNPYGSRGGYVRDSRGRRDRADMDYRYGRDRNDYTEHYDRYDSRYDRYDGYDERDYRDYEYDRYDSRYDRDYAVDEMEKEYMHELNEWIAKLKKKDRYKLSEPEVIKKAKDMGVKFDNFDEKEFLLETNMGNLLIKGEGLEIIKLDTYQGDVSIKGKIDSLAYTENSNKKQKNESVLSKLFK